MKPALVALGVAALLAAPLLGLGDYALGVGISFATFAVLSAGLNLVYGYAGMMSYAQVGFFGIGAYTAAVLVQDHAWPFPPAALAGGVLATAVSLLLGYTSLRLSRHAFSIVSLSFSLLCVILARDWVGLTRGPMGRPGLAAGMLATPLHFYYATIGLALVVHAAIFWIVTSRIGRAMRAVKLNEPLAESQGVSPRGLKLFAIGVSAFTAALAGSVFVFHLSIVDPSVFDFYYTEAMLIMVIVGGAGSFWCVLLATAVFTILPDILRFTPDLRMVLYGLILIAAMLLLPGGLGGWLRAREIAAWRRPTPKAAS